jgi:hypothetical protein
MYHPFHAIRATRFSFANKRGHRDAGVVPLFLDCHSSDNRGFLRRRSGPSLIISCKNSKNSGIRSADGPVVQHPIGSALQPERENLL